MIYLILFWLICLTAGGVILYLESRVRQEAKEVWTVPSTSFAGEITFPKGTDKEKTREYVEFLGGDRVGEIMAEKKDVKIDDILTN